MFNFFRRSEDSKREPLAPAEQEAEKEIVPEHSAEILETVGRIDERIRDSENLLGGLGRVAREQILTDPEALDEIYARKEIGRGKLSKEDAWAFAPAGLGLEVRSAIRRVASLGLAGRSKYALEGEKGGLVDTRELRQNVKEEMATPGGYGLRKTELGEAAKNLGLEALEEGEKGSDKYLKRYQEGEKGEGKIYLERKTEQEMDKTAGEILERRLKDLETRTGPELVKQKQGLEEFIKLKEQNKDLLGEAEVQEKLNEEETIRQGLIDEKQEVLNNDLAVFRSPLLEQQKGLAEALESFSPLLAEATGEEKAYEQEIKGLQDKIRRIKGAKPLAEVLGDKIQAWEEQKEQAEVNLKDFREKKQALNKRLAALRTSQAEVDRTLERINKIGKTPAELKAEREEKQRKEAEAAKAKRNKQPPAAAPAAEPATGSAESIVDDDGGTDDDLADQEGARQTAAAQEADKINQAINENKAVVRPRASAAVKPAAVATRAEAAAPAPRPAEGQGAEKREKIEPVRYWLNRIFKIILPNDAQQVMKKHFRVGSSFNLTAPMTMAQAMEAYVGYLRESKSMSLAAARETTLKHFQRTFGAEGEVSGAAEPIAERPADAPSQAENAVDLRPDAGTIAPSQPAPAQSRERAQVLNGMIDDDQARADAASAPDQPEELKEEQARSLSELELALESGKLQNIATHKARRGQKPRVEARAAATQAPDAAGSETQRVKELDSRPAEAEQTETAAVDKRKPKDKGEAEPADKSRAARKLKLNELKADDLDDGGNNGEEDEPADIPKDEEGSGAGGEVNPLTQNLADPLSEALDKLKGTLAVDEKKDEKSAGAPEQAEINLKEAEFTTKKLLKKLGLKTDDPKEKEVIERLFVAPSEPGFNKKAKLTESQAEAAYLGYLRDANRLGDMSEDEARKKVKELIKHIYNLQS